MTEDYNGSKSFDAAINMRGSVAPSDYITSLKMEAFDNKFLADLIHKVVKELKKNLSQDWTSEHGCEKGFDERRHQRTAIAFYYKTIMEEAKEQYKKWPNEA